MSTTGNPYQNLDEQTNAQIPKHLYGLYKNIKLATVSATTSCYDYLYQWYFVIYILYA